MISDRYVHGYSQREARRLRDQADSLARLLHHDTTFLDGSWVLEIGCGTGSQTIFLASASPGARIVSADLSADSLSAARARLRGQGLHNVHVQRADLYALPYRERSFDHAFVCFVLEHLPDPSRALASLRRVLKPGGEITVIEGDHGSWSCHPDSPAAARCVRCLVELQAALGGDALIGRRLYPLVRGAGFRDVRVSPRMVYTDGSRPDLAEGFSRNTFIAMVEGVRDQAVGQGLIDADAWDRGIRDMYRATEEDGTFCYTFFKARGILP